MIRYVLQRIALLVPVLLGVSVLVFFSLYLTPGDPVTAVIGDVPVSEETRARVIAAAEQLNYKVDKNASGLRRRRSRTLAVLFEEAAADDGGLINPFYLSMLGAMVRKCADLGYDLLISFQDLSSDWHAG